MSNLIIFDLDGVITGEEAYWDAAGLTLHELLYSSHYWNITPEKPYYSPETAEESRRISRAIFPESAILALKARAINSNWDTSYSAICLHLIDLLVLLKEPSHESLLHLLPLRPWDADWLAAFRRQITHCAFNDNETSLADMAYRQYENVFASPIFDGFIGLELINCLDVYASAVLETSIRGVFSRHSPFWSFCQNIFQEWYLGDTLYTQTYGHQPAQFGKPGCIHFEHPLLPVGKERITLEILRQRGYVLGFATGRMLQEAEYPLKMYGLLDYFDDRHIATYDAVEQAEAILRARDDFTLLSKPDPFQFLRAVDRHYLVGVVGATFMTPFRLPGKKSIPFIVVGDSTGDILGGRAAGAVTVAVLTGARTDEARALLAQSKPDFTIQDMTALPALLADIDNLATIQYMQFMERETAERLLQLWFERHMHLTTESVTLTPRATSLNSFNGFYRSEGEAYFFKTHVEEQGILEEYYNAELLHKAGYNIVQPLRMLHEKGRQMMIYPVVQWPVMFDLVRAVETGNAESGTIERLTEAEQQECQRLLNIYRSTFASSTDEESTGAKSAPIHQLFWHRLAGERFKHFYEGKHVPFPPYTRQLSERHQSTSGISFDELLTYHWVINGVEQQQTLGEIVERAKVALEPTRPTATIIGHGDAHFGNVFLEGEQNKQTGRYLYFDPAFAGRHSPLLDVIKPLFHNVFATWMYFPDDIAQNLQLSISVDDTGIFVEHTYTLTPIRRAILQTKIQYHLTPLIAELRARDALPVDWSAIVQSALMCCALLTINLLDEERMGGMPPAISWLGLSLAVQMGNSGVEAWRNDL